MDKHFTLFHGKQKKVEKVSDLPESDEANLFETFHDVLTILDANSPRVSQNRINNILSFAKCFKTYPSKNIKNIELVIN